MARPVSRPDLWSRLWESRAARLAWAAAVATLLLGHVVLSLPGRPPAPRPAAPLMLASATPDPELAEAVTLPRLGSGRLPQLDTAPVREPAQPAPRAAAQGARHDA
jgi:hypothetical protein